MNRIFGILSGAVGFDTGSSRSGLRAGLAGVWNGLACTRARMALDDGVGCVCVCVVGRGQGSASSLCLSFIIFFGLGPFVPGSEEDRGSVPRSLCPYH